MFDILDDIYIIYIIGKYKLNLISKMELIINIKKYITNKGQIFIKLIQLLLIHQYRWGNHFTTEELEELNKLLSKVEHKKKYIPNELNDYFEIGCGSVARVSFKDFNRKRVIKKLLPDINKNIIDSFLKLKKMVSYAKILGYDIIYQDNLNIYLNFMVKQTNLINEGKNIIRLAKLFKDCERINLPKVYKLSKDLIEMEYVKGIFINDFLEKYPKYYEDVMYLLFSAIYQMIDHKFIHGDFHEGNFLFYLNDNKVYMNIIDLGIVNIIDENKKVIFKKYLFRNKKEDKINFYYELTNKKISLNKFKDDFIKNKIKENIDPFILIETLKKLKYEINFEFFNLILSIVAYTKKFSRKFDYFQFRIFFRNNFGYNIKLL